MTKVEIDGRTYCVETLIYTVERLTKDIKASAECHRLVLEQIRAEIDELETYYDNDYFSGNRDAMFKCNDVLQIIDKYRKEIQHD